MRRNGGFLVQYVKALTVSAYITLAPPPATIVQMRPFGFKTVNFRDALVCNFKHSNEVTHMLPTSAVANYNSMAELRLRIGQIRRYNLIKKIIYRTECIYSRSKPIRNLKNFRR